MEYISEELVNETWHEAAGFSDERAQKEIAKISKSQPNLLAFMIEFTRELDQEVQELGLYLFFVIYRMFNKDFKKRIKKVSPENIIKCYAENEKSIRKLEGAHEKFFERMADRHFSQQPYVMKYLVEALMEAPEEEDPVNLTEDDIGYLFLLLKTLIDLLDEAVRTAPKKS
jgi:hypothetical protein